MLFLIEIVFFVSKLIDFYIGKSFFYINDLIRLGQLYSRFYLIIKRVKYLFCVFYVGDFFYIVKG